MAACDKCSFDYFQVIAEFYNDAKSLAFFLSHSVLPSEIICPHCFSNCNYREDQSVWRCRKSSVVPKSKKRRFCGFSVSDYKGSFLDHTYIAPWKVLLFINQRRSKGKSCIYYYFLFYCVLFLVFPVHRDLDLIVLSSESRFILVGGGGGGSPPKIFSIYSFFFGGGGRGGCNLFLVYIP